MASKQFILTEACDPRTRIPKKNPCFFIDLLLTNKNDKSPISDIDDIGDLSLVKERSIRTKQQGKRINYFSKLSSEKMAPFSSYIFRLIISPS